MSPLEKVNQSQGFARTAIPRSLSDKYVYSRTVAIAFIATNQHQFCYSAAYYNDCYSKLDKIYCTSYLSLNTRL